MFRFTRYLFLSFGRSRWKFRPALSGKPPIFRTSISSFTLVGSTNRSWWLKPTHLKKYDRQIGSSLQVGRGEHEKTTLKPPFSKWFQRFLCFVIHFLATKDTYSFNQRWSGEWWRMYLAFMQFTCMYCNIHIYVYIFKFKPMQSVLQARYPLLILWNNNRKIIFKTIALQNSDLYT